MKKAYALWKSIAVWKKIIVSILLIISILAGFGVAKVQMIYTTSLNHITRDEDTSFSEMNLDDIELEKDDEIINILLIGNDARQEAGYSSKTGLTDAMMIATMDKKHRSLKLTTLMRDTLVEVTEANQKRKLNSAWNYGGVKNLYKTIATNFNIKLDGYVMVGFDAFEKVINAVGGVEVELTDTEVRYLNMTNYTKKKNHTFEVGKHTLNGNQALGYCRIRKGMDKIGEPVVTANGLTDDYGRTWRQRTVLSAVFDKMKTLPMTEWINVANSILDNIRTDLDNETITGYITDVVTLGTTTVKQLQIPMMGYFRSGTQSEFPDSEGSSLVPTNGISSEWDPSTNADIMKQFIFKYNGKDAFQYNDPNKIEEPEEYESEGR